MVATAQYFAPQGLGELSQGERYYCLRHDARQGRVFMASFFSERPGVTLHVLTTAVFETALADRTLVHCDTARHLPPWNSALEGVDLDGYDGDRRKAHRRHRDLVEQRRAYIQPLIENQNQIFAADNPDLEINQYARLANPRQNETRLRLWFYLYLAFAQSVWALLPPFHKNGHWSRDEEKYLDQPMGRLSKHGRKHGFRCGLTMQTTIIDCYSDYAAKGRSMLHIYELSMRHKFECVTHTRADGSVAFVHPQGKPFPSENQFRYYCKRKFGLESIRRTRFGDQRYRTDFQGSQGSFSQSVASLMEIVEADAYFTSEHPRGYAGDHDTPPLVVVRLICVLSGMIVGIGFSHGSETAEAYLAALFCAAMNKREFCELFGLTISDEMWPCEGLPPYLIPDRGAGASKQAWELAQEHIPILGLTPSHTPQSHATVESHHPRDVHTQGAPSFKTVDLDAVGLARREILNAIAHNKSSSAVNRLTPDMRGRRVLPTPLGIWNDMAARGRSDAQSISFADAARSFLTPVEFQLADARLFLKKLAYGSDEWCAALSAKHRNVRAASVVLPGYALSMCVRNAWVTIDNRLVRVEAQLPIRDDDKQLYMSLTDLEAYEERTRQDRLRVDANRPAAISEVAELSQKQLGAELTSSRLKKGRCKAKTAVSKREIQHVKHTRAGAPK
jgi:hypothetical protein